ncbi:MULTISPECIES: hypothetical protein [Novosphingobium]|uniref:hypothetical protein n=1 Tax=Novosphingobium sp. TCA1 TaxID=2682474 RepID=UPI000A3868BD|nr:MULTISPECIES: hypothetical protein [Novosphingobium]GFE73377.1 hypothetical protein NTCA1_10260 [Novosphingobium sp. TCA1]
MSDDRRPAKVRVFSSGTPDGNSPGAKAGQNAAGQAQPNNPGRRRTDAPQIAALDAATPAAKSGGALWVMLAAVLFLIGSALGGVLFTMSVLFPGALL